MKVPPLPNIVYVLADDMGYGDLSCLNPDSRIHTTHLDVLARDGMRFTDAHASSAVCTPSRYSILTGRYNWRSQLKSGVTWGDSGPVIEAGRMTVASLLRGQGYATACIGKWHLGWDWSRRKDGSIDYTSPIRQGPTTCGFDRFVGLAASLDMPPYVWVEGDRVTAPPDHVLPASSGLEFWRQGPAGPDFCHGNVLPRLIQEGEDFIRSSVRAGKPFFLYLPLTAPHTPILPSARFRGRSGTNSYGDFCLEIDDAVGRLRRVLESCGEADKTIFIFTSDNGCSPMADLAALGKLGHHPSYHFRGHKADIYEGGHRIPLLVSWPGVIEPDSTCDQTVCLSDLFATCAEIVGADPGPDAGEDSFSNLDLWRGLSSGPVRDTTIHSSIDGSFSIRSGRWKLEMCAGSGGWTSPRPGPECEGLPRVQLYDLEADPGERLNVYDRHPEVVRRLQELLTTQILAGRSTPGPRQSNTGPPYWPELWWIPPDHSL